MPFPRHVLLVILTGAALLGAVMPAGAGTPTDRLRGFFAAVDALLVDPATAPLDKVAQVKRLVTDLADVPGASAEALGAEWSRRSPAEQQEFTSLFAELLERAYVGRLAGTLSASNGVTLRWLDETLSGERATVRTAVRARDGRDVIVEYRMALRRGRWLVNDVVLDGVSTVANYRAQFRRLLAQGSYRDMLTALRGKIAEETLMFARAGRAPVMIVVAPEAPAPAASTPPPAAVAPPPLEPAPQVAAMVRATPPPAASLRPAPPAAVPPSAVVTSIVAPLLPRVPAAPPAPAPAVRAPEPLRVAAIRQIPRPPVAPPALDGIDVPSPSLSEDGEGGPRPAVVAIVPEPRVEREVEVAALEAAGLGLRMLLLGVVAGVAAVYLGRTETAG